MVGILAHQYLFELSYIYISIIMYMKQLELFKVPKPGLNGIRYIKPVLL